MSDEKLDISKINHWINSAPTMEFAWGSDEKNIQEHTSLILYFNETPLFAIGFGAIMHANSFQKSIITGSGLLTSIAQTLGSSASIIAKGASKIVAKVPLPGYIDIDLFDDRTTKIKGKFMKLAIDYEEGKLRAKQLIEVILAIDMGFYQLMENNCRHFIIKVAELLKHEPEFTQENWNQFETAMQLLKSTDDLKFEGAVECSPEMLKNAITEIFSQPTDEEKTKKSSSVPLVS